MTESAQAMRLHEKYYRSLVISSPPELFSEGENNFMKKSILNDIGLYKTRLISTFINSPDICRLLLEKDSYTQDEADSLLYTRIFPYLHINTQADMNACLCFEVDVPPDSHRHDPRI